MKLITLNLWQGRLKNNFPNFITSQQADIICLQEVWSANFDLPTLDTFHSRQRIEETSGLEFSYFSPTFAITMLGEKVQFGNLLLSRYPFKSTNTFFNHEQYMEFESPEEFINNIRNAQIVKLDVDGAELNVVNHHGFWVPDSNGSEESLKKLQILADELVSIESPLIVAGDFNLASSTDAIKQFKTNLNLIDLNNGNIESTLSADVTPLIADCDYIFIRQDIKVESFAVSNQLVSDHKALILEFNF